MIYCVNVVSGLLWKNRREKKYGNLQSFIERIKNGFPKGERFKEFFKNGRR